MENTKKPKTDYAFVHGEYIKIDDDHDAYVAFLKHIETGEVKFKIINDPVVNIWVTKPAYRTYTHKREWSSKDELDEYTCRYLHRAECIWNALNASEPGKRYVHLPYVNLRKMLASPFVYGADIDMGVRVKHAFQKLNGDRKIMNFTVGHLDIETDVNAGGDIILITFMNSDGNTYTGILKQFLRDHTLEEVERMFYDQAEPKFRSELNKKAKAAYESSDPIKLHLKLYDTEVDLIKWIFDCIHKCRPDFVTIWNMAFDIQYILDRLAFRQVDPKTVFCSNDIPHKYQVCDFHEDTSGEHITDNWSWLHCTDYTRYIDAMCCYGRLRKAKGREPSYALNDICDTEIGTGKLVIDVNDGISDDKIHFHPNMDHHIAQRDYPVEYSAYNIIDVLLMRVLELKNTDVRTMMMLIGDSCLEDFAKQTAKLKNMFFVYLEPLNGAPASSGGSLEVPWDKYQTNKGGQVLDPELTRGTGVSILVDSDRESYVHKLVADEDVSLITLATCSRNATRKTFLIAGTFLRRKSLQRDLEKCA